MARYINADKAIIEGECFITRDRPNGHEQGINRGIRSVFKILSDTTLRVPGTHNVDAEMVIKMGKALVCKGHLNAYEQGINRGLNLMFWILSDTARTPTITPD